MADMHIALGTDLVYGMKHDDGLLHLSLVREEAIYNIDEEYGDQLGIVNVTE